MLYTTAAEKMSNIICGILFFAFIFLYLLYLQGDVVGYAQHILSQGVTTYNPLIGAIIITITMMIVSALTYLVIRGTFPFLLAIAHLPAALLLALLTDVHSTHEGHLFGNTWIYAIVIIVLFALAVLLFRDNLFHYREFWRALFANMLTIVCLITFIAARGNNETAFHQQLRAEQYARHKDYDRLVAYVHDHPSRSNLFLRAYALSQQGQLAETFFDEPYAQECTSDDLLPSDSYHPLLLDPMDIFRPIGGYPAPGITARRCLQLLYLYDRSTPIGRDYLLTATLLDGDTTAFRAIAHDMCLDTIPHDSLPRYFRLIIPATAE